MNIAMKVDYILVTIGCLLLGISADDNLECRIIDFNKENSINLFENCDVVTPFALKSFADNPLVYPYNEDSVNYLGNTKEGNSCSNTIENFSITEETELSTAIYLRATVIEDTSQVTIEIIDLDDEGSSIPIIDAIPIITWTPYNRKFNMNITNAKISIRAYITETARFAIQYLHIIKPGVDESLCEIVDDTTPVEETTDETTTDETTTDETTTDETTTDETTTDETTTDETTTEETATEETTTDETATEETTTEETTTEETTTEETTTEETTTEETTTEETTTEETTTEETTTTINQTTPDSNDNRVWIITSFVFLFTTIGLISGFIYLIYLYKTALAAKTAMLSAATIQPTPKSIPRLTVSTTSQGNQVIVGIDHIKQM